MSLQPVLNFNNGKKIPSIGLGTWKSNEAVTLAVFNAIKAGYRHIDCAWAYDNEKAVGQGIRMALESEELNLTRADLFITSKLWCTYHSRVQQCLDQTLENLGTDYLDLYLVHWPVPLNPEGNDPVFPLLPNGRRDVAHSWDLKKTWEGMEDVLLNTRKVRSIGVSNFSQAKLEEILPTARIVPVVDQLELHVYNPQHKLLAYLRSKNILPQAYSPLGSTDSPLLRDEVVVEIAEKHALKSADVLLGYLLSKDIVILPKSVNAERIQSNFTGAIEASTKLERADIQRLDELAANGKQKRFITPPWPVDLGFDNWPPMPPLPA